MIDLGKLMRSYDHFLENIIRPIKKIYKAYIFFDEKVFVEIAYHQEFPIFFQPHLFSRTRDLLDEFANVLSEFDAVILLDIYPAREEPISGVSSEILLQKIKSNNKYLSKKSDLSDMIKNIGYKVNVTLGAGDIGKEVEQIKSELEYAV